MFVTQAMASVGRVWTMSYIVLYKLMVETYQFISNTVTNPVKDCRYISFSLGTQIAPMFIISSQQHTKSHF